MTNSPIEPSEQSELHADCSFSRCDPPHIPSAFCWNGIPNSPHVVELDSCAFHVQEVPVRRDERLAVSRQAPMPGWLDVRALNDAAMPAHLLL